jgi:hypothetical protein
MDKQTLNTYLHILSESSTYGMLKASNCLDFLNPVNYQLKSNQACG